MIARTIVASDDLRGALSVTYLTYAHSSSSCQLIPQFPLLLFTRGARSWRSHRGLTSVDCPIQLLEQDTVSPVYVPDPYGAGGSWLPLSFLKPELSEGLSAS
ncbi:hypothetical protein Tco_0569142 [Tanacetum coccineum]